MFESSFLGARQFLRALILSCFVAFPIASRFGPTTGISEFLASFNPTPLLEYNSAPEDRIATDSYIRMFVLGQLLTDRKDSCRSYTPILEPKGCFQREPCRPMEFAKLVGYLLISD